MADPAGRLIAATTNANSALFICASQVLQRTFIRPLCRSSPDSKLHEGKENRLMRGGGYQVPSIRAITSLSSNVIRSDDRVQLRWPHQRSTRIIRTPDESTDMFGKKHDEALFGALHHMQMILLARVPT